MIIKPTRGNGKPNLLTISVHNGDYEPYSYSRSQNVGVGGLMSRIAQGEPVRRATQNEMRTLARETIASMLRLYPNGTIYVQRSRK